MPIYILEQTPQDLLSRDVTLIDYKSRREAITRLARETANKRIAEKLYNFLVRFPHIFFFPDSMYNNVKYERVISKKIVNKRTMGSTFNQWAAKIVMQTADNEKYWAIINFGSDDNSITCCYCMALNDIMPEEKIAEFNSFFRAKRIENILKSL